MRSWFVIPFLLLTGVPAFATTMILCTQIKELRALRTDAAPEPIRREVETTEIPLQFFPVTETEAYAGLALSMRILPLGYITTVQVFESTVDGKAQWKSRIRTSNIEGQVKAEGFDENGRHSFEEANSKYETVCEAFVQRAPKRNVHSLSIQELRRLNLLGGPPNLRVYNDSTHFIDHYELWKHILTLPGTRASNLRAQVQRLKRRRFNHFDLGTARQGAVVSGTSEVACGLIGQLQCSSLILKAFYWNSEGLRLANRQAASIAVEIRIYRRNTTGEILRYTVGPAKVTIDTEVSGAPSKAEGRIRSN